MKLSYLALAAGASVLLGAGGCVDRAAQAQSKQTEKLLSDPVRVVSTTAAKTMDLVDQIEVTGDVTAGQDSSLGAKQAGRLSAVYVEDGDTVSAGQVVARLEDVNLQAQLLQAQSQVSSALAQGNQALAQRTQAEASLAQALKNLTNKPNQSSSSLRQAKAQLASAQAQLEKAKNGARPEERNQAESNVRSAKSNLDTQEAELKRIQVLVKEGAVAANRLDQQKTSTESARTQYRNALDSLSLIKVGTRQEDLDVAQAAVRQAEEAVANAQVQKSLDPLLQDQVKAARGQVAAAIAQYESAQSQLQSAKAQVMIAQEAVKDAMIRAPFAGRIAGKPLQAGVLVSSSTTVARIVGGNGVYFTGQVASAEINRLQPGMSVDIAVDAVSGRKYAGTVAAISALGQSVGRLFDVRIQFKTGIGDVRPGMFARGSITIKKVPGATVVPEAAVVRRGEEKFLFVVSNGHSKRIDVKVGISQAGFVQVSGVNAGDKVVTAGQQSLTDNAPVREGDQKLTLGKTRAVPTMGS